jgi:hypothetical protein
VTRTSGGKQKKPDTEYHEIFHRDSSRRRVGAVSMPPKNISSAAVAK